MSDQTTFGCTRGRGKPVGSLYVPTAVDVAGSRHIIPGKDLAPLCGAETPIADQYGPDTYRPERLCLRCRQRYLKRLVHS